MVVDLVKEDKMTKLLNFCTWCFNSPIPFSSYTSWAQWIDSLSVPDWSWTSVWLWLVIGCLPHRSVSWNQWRDKTVSVLAQVLESCHAKDLATCCYPVLNAYYGINTDSYDLCDVRDSVVYSGEGVVKRGEQPWYGQIFSCHASRLIPWPHILRTEYEDW